MVGEPEGRRRLLEEVAAIYDWIDRTAEAGARPRRALQGVRGLL